MQTLDVIYRLLVYVVVFGLFQLFGILPSPLETQDFLNLAIIAILFEVWRISYNIGKIKDRLGE